MFLDINSLKIKIPGGTYVSLGNYITEAKYGYHKIWASDSGRNLAGAMSGTLIGIFPKITMQFGMLTKTQVQTIAPILDAPNQVVRYYDPKKQTYVEMTTYTGDYEITNRNIVDDDTPNEGFPCSFISVRKRV